MSGPPQWPNNVISLPLPIPMPEMPPDFQGRLFREWKRPVSQVEARNEWNRRRMENWYQFQMNLQRQQVQQQQQMMIPVPQTSGVIQGVQTNLQPQQVLQPRQMMQPPPYSPGIQTNFQHQQVPPQQQMNLPAAYTPPGIQMNLPQQRAPQHQQGMQPTPPTQSVLQINIPQQHELIFSPPLSSPEIQNGQLPQHLPPQVLSIKIELENQLKRPISDQEALKWINFYFEENRKLRILQREQLFQKVPQQNQIEQGVAEGSVTVPPPIIGQYIVAKEQNLQNGLLPQASRPMTVQTPGLNPQGPSQPGQQQNEPLPQASRPMSAQTSGLNPQGAAQPRQQQNGLLPQASRPMTVQTPGLNPQRPSQPGQQQNGPPQPVIHQGPPPGLNPRRTPGQQQNIPSTSADRLVTVQSTPSGPPNRGRQQSHQLSIRDSLIDNIISARETLKEGGRFVKPLDRPLREMTLEQLQAVFQESGAALAQYQAQEAQERASIGAGDPTQKELAEIIGVFTGWSALTPNNDASREQFDRDLRQEHRNMKTRVSQGQTTWAQEIYMARENLRVAQEQRLAEQKEAGRRVQKVWEEETRAQKWVAQQKEKERVAKVKADKKAEKEKRKAEERLAQLKRKEMERQARIKEQEERAVAVLEQVMQQAMQPLQSMEAMAQQITVEPSALQKLLAAPVATVTRQPRNHLDDLFESLGVNARTSSQTLLGQQKMSYKEYMAKKTGEQQKKQQEKQPDVQFPSVLEGLRVKNPLLAVEPLQKEITQESLAVEDEPVEKTVSQEQDDGGQQDLNLVQEVPSQETPCQPAQEELAREDLILFHQGQVQEMLSQPSRDEPCQPALEDLSLAQEEPAREDLSMDQDESGQEIMSETNQDEPSQQPQEDLSQDEPIPPAPEELSLVQEEPAREDLSMDQDESAQEIPSQPRQDEPCAEAVDDLRLVQEEPAQKDLSQPIQDMDQVAQEILSQPSQDEPFQEPLEDLNLTQGELAQEDVSLVQNESDQEIPSQPRQDEPCPEVVDDLSLAQKEPVQEDLSLFQKEAIQDMLSQPSQDEPALETAILAQDQPPQEIPSQPSQAVKSQPAPEDVSLVQDESAQAIPSQDGPLQQAQEELSLAQGELAREDLSLVQQEPVQEMLSQPSQTAQSQLAREDSSSPVDGSERLDEVPQEVLNISQPAQDQLSLDEPMELEEQAPLGQGELSQEAMDHEEPANLKRRSDQAEPLTTISPPPKRIRQDSTTVRQNMEAQRVERSGNSPTFAELMNQEQIQAAPEPELAAPVDQVVEQPESSSRLGYQDLRHIKICDMTEEQNRQRLEENARMMRQVRAVARSLIFDHAEKNRAAYFEMIRYSVEMFAAGNQPKTMDEFLDRMITFCEEKGI